MGVTKGNNTIRYRGRLLALLILVLSCSGDEIEAEYFQSSNYTYSSFEVEIFDLVNEHRNLMGQNQLGILTEISEQARSHSEHMLAAKEICHHNFGSRYHALSERVGAKAMGENVGFGYRNSISLFKAWLASPHHRKIIEGESSDFGISAINGEGKSYVTLIFIRK